ncbi:MAG TPA: hypothetical protein VGF67_27000 [Ktedonobacteraceae bacterium]|jgi:hypothetical protein
MANAGACDAECFGLARDALASGALVVQRVRKRAGAIPEDALQAAGFPVGVGVTALPLRESERGAALAGGGGKPERTAKAWSLRAVGMREEKAGGHAQALLAERDAIAVAPRIGVTVLRAPPPHQPDSYPPEMIKL